MENDDSNYWAMEGSIHVIAKAEYTLCGAALEGEDGDNEGMPVVPQRITCEECVNIIKYIKAIPNKYHRDRKPSTRKNRFDRLNDVARLSGDING